MRRGVPRPPVVPPIPPPPVILPTPKYQHWFKWLILGISRYTKFVTFSLSFVSISSNNLPDYFSDAFGQNIFLSFLIVALIYTFLALAFYFVHFAPSPVYLRQLQERYLFWRWFPDVVMVGIQLGMDMSCPILSAYVGSKFEAEDIHIVTWIAFGILFMCSAYSSLLEYGSVESCVAVVLGLLFAKEEKPKLLARLIGLDYMKKKNKKKLLIIFTAFIPAIRRTLLIGFRVLDQWAQSNYRWSQFLEKKYPNPTGGKDHDTSIDVEKGRMVETKGRRQSASDSEIGRKVGAPLKLTTGAQPHRD